MVTHPVSKWTKCSSSTFGDVAGWNRSLTNLRVEKINIESVVTPLGGSHTLPQGVSSSDALQRAALLPRWLGPGPRYARPTCGCVIVVDVYAGHGGELDDIPGEVFLVESVVERVVRLSRRGGWAIRGFCRVEGPLTPYGSARGHQLPPIVYPKWGTRQASEEDGLCVPSLTRIPGHAFQQRVDLERLLELRGL